MEPFALEQKVKTKTGYFEGVVKRIYPPKPIYTIHGKLTHTLPHRAYVKLLSGKFKGEHMIFAIDELEAA